MKQEPRLRNIARLQNNSITRSSGCVEWTGCKDSRGYGFCYDSVTRKQTYSHRLSYETYVGEIPANMVICHECNNPSCIAVCHLRAATSKDNSAQMIREMRHRTVAHPRHSPEKIASIKADLRAGKTAYSVSKSTGVSEQHVNHIRRRMNLQPAGRKPKPCNPEENAGCTLLVAA